MFGCNKQITQMCEERGWWRLDIVQKLSEIGSYAMKWCEMGVCIKQICQTSATFCVSMSILCCHLSGLRLYKPFGLLWGYFCALWCDTDCNLVFDCNSLCCICYEHVCRLYILIECCINKRLLLLLCRPITQINTKDDVDVGNWMLLGKRDKYCYLKIC